MLSHFLTIRKLLGNSLHEVKQNLNHLIKNEGKIQLKELARGPRAVWQKKTPQHFYKIQRKPTHRNTQAGSKYTQRQLGSF